jgi:predicted nucleotidyltransferase
MGESDRFTKDTTITAKMRLKKVRKRKKRQFEMHPLELSNLCDVFSRYDEIEKVILYGSRARGTHKPASDIDLALVGDKITFAMYNALSDDVDALELSCFAEMSNYRYMSRNPCLIENVERDGIVIYSKVSVH